MQPSPNPSVTEGYPLHADVMVMQNALPVAGRAVGIAKDETSAPFATATTDANGLATFEIPSEPLREGLGLGPPTPVNEIPSVWIRVPGTGNNPPITIVVWVPFKPADYIRTYPRYEPEPNPVYIQLPMPTPEPEPTPPPMPGMTTVPLSICLYEQGVGPLGGYQIEHVRDGNVMSSQMTDGSGMATFSIMAEPAQEDPGPIHPGGLYVPIMVPGSGSTPPKMITLFVRFAPPNVLHYPTVEEPPEGSSTRKITVIRDLLVEPLP